MTFPTPALQQRHHTPYSNPLGARQAPLQQAPSSPRLRIAPHPDSVPRGLLVAAALALSACSDPAPSRDSAAAPPPPTATSAAPAPARPAGPLIEWMPAPDGDLAAIAKSEAERAKKDGRVLLVYAGATWCEPCQRFHEAAVAGEIQGDLPPLRMLELDLDRDGDRLAAAGYGSRMIPLFAVPGPDGRGSDLRIEGSIKGSGAVSNIVPRLRALLSRARGS